MCSLWSPDTRCDCSVYLVADALEVEVYAPDGSPLQQRYSAGSAASSHNRRSLSQAAAAAAGALSTITQSLSLEPSC